MASDRFYTLNYDEPEIPPRVEYQVTPLGLSLVPAVLALAEWAAAHTAEIAANRDAYDAAAE